MKTFSELVAEMFAKKSFEREPRLAKGHFGYVRHRFPIKDGISGYDVAVKNIEKNNPLYRMLLGKS